VGHLVALATAVRMLGIQRAELQRLVHDGDLAAPDGMVDIDHIKALYPSLALKESPVFERIQLIKTTAFSRRVRSTVTPERDALESQLSRRNTELSLERAMAKKYRELIEELAEKLRQMQNCDDPAQRRVVGELNGWLLSRLQK